MGKTVRARRLGLRIVATAALVAAGCASAPEPPPPGPPGVEVSRYDVGGTTYILTRQERAVDAAGASQGATISYRGLYTPDGREVIAPRLDLEVAVTGPPYTFFVEPWSWSPRGSLAGVWRRLTPAGLEPEPLPFNDAVAVVTSDGPRWRVFGPALLALCGPDLDVERASLRFDHVVTAEESGGGGETFVVHCRWTEPDGAERTAITVVDGLLRPVSPPGAATLHLNWSSGFPGRVFAWRDAGGWRLLCDGRQRLDPGVRELVPGADPRPGGFTLGFVAVSDGPGGEVRRLVDTTGSVRAEGVRTARVVSAANGAFDGPRPEPLWWKDARGDMTGGRFEWSATYGVWLVERLDGSFEVRWPDDKWATLATARGAGQALAAAERVLTARVRQQRDREDRARFDMAERERREREALAREHAAEEAARARHEAALAAWRAEQEAAWAQARVDVERARGQLDAWSRSWEETRSTPFYSGAGPTGGDDGAHRAFMAETEAKTRALQREVDAHR